MPLDSSLNWKRSSPSEKPIPGTEKALFGIDELELSDSACLNLARGYFSRVNWNHVGFVEDSYSSLEGRGIQPVHINHFIQAVEPGGDGYEPSSIEKDFTYQFNSLHNANLLWLYQLLY